MKILATQWIIIIFTISIIIIAAKSDDIDYSGVISIDCGVNESYNDPANNIRYQADDNEVVQFGQIQNFDSVYTFSNQIQKELMSLRSFPYGKRNCYTLKPKQGKNQKYIMRAYFAYWNYDNKNKIPVFDLHLGVNYFGTVDLNTVDSVLRLEAIHLSSTDTIELCLVNTEQGIPFISLLELWHLGSTLYPTSDNLLPLFLDRRTNLGMSERNEEFKRYMDDIYGRSWFVEKDLGLGSDGYQMTTSSVVIDLQKIDNPYELPLDVLKSAGVAPNESNSLNIRDNLSGYYEYYVYLHFFDFLSHNNEKRIMEITISGSGSGDKVTELLDLKSLTPTTIVKNVKEGMGIDSILIQATPESDLPAMLNAFEIYSVVSQPNYATQEDDVDASRNIRDIYNISRIDWQGDPCQPTNFTWEGVTCQGDNNPGIISLNLSSSNLSGEIDVAFSKLKHLEILDLSNNELTGVVPKFLGELPKLTTLNLSSNNLSGSIPESLKDKSNLQLSLDGNQGLCLTGSCIIKRHKSNVWLVASITVTIAVLLIVAIVTMIWRMIKSRKVKGLVMFSSSSKKIEQLNNKSRTFKHSEVVSITNDFETMIGRGGFGKVYLGKLEGGETVAVKTLSLSASQGHKEFISEAKLLMTVHHRHVVTLVGYCDEGDTRALIYEYLPGGNLHQRLSGKNSNILDWNERLQIALDVASGLDYLHNGCPLAIIHRDLKPSNILLHENMRAKISDFGLSRAFINDNDTHVLTEYPGGTPGYVDPFHSSGILNKKSDVYSFGVILLELITGQKAIIDTADDDKIHILPWVNLKLKTGDIQAIVDPTLQGKYTNTSAWRFTEIAMSCLRQLAAERPDIKDIVSELKDLSQEILSLERNVSNNRNSSGGDSMGIEPSELDSGLVPR